MTCCQIDCYFFLIFCYEFHLQINIIDFFHNIKNKSIKKVVKLFSLLVISTVIVHVSAWFIVLASGLFNLELIRSIFPLYKLSPLISYRMLQLDFDGGYFEHFQYILLLWCFILSSSWIISKKYWEGFYISLIYLYLFIDDVFRIHDGFLGLYLSNLFESNFISDQQIIRVKDFGEWSYWAIVFLY